MNHIKTWQERMPELKTAWQCAMNCSGMGQKSPGDNCGDCESYTVHGDPVAARDAEISDLRVALAAQLERVLVPKGLIEIGQLLHTQDEQYTANAMFVIERKRILAGCDPDYSQGADDVVWCIEDSMIFLGDDGFDDLEGAYQEDGTVPENYTRTCYLVKWDFVTAFFTDEAAKAFVSQHGHKYDGELRVMVEGEPRNDEWKKLRNWMMSFAAALASTTQAAPSA